MAPDRRPVRNRGVAPDNRPARNSGVAPDNRPGRNSDVAPDNRPGRNSDVAPNSDNIPNRGSEPQAPAYDAVLVLSFGGPEGPEDVDPFLRTMLQGRDVPEARIAEVAAHYHHFGGVSPINGQNRALVAALADELANADIALPVYWGNRNWAPTLVDEVRRMRDDGIRRALAFVTSAYASYSGCRQYLDDIDAARAQVGAGAPVIDKLRLFFNHPGFIETWVGSLLRALSEAAGARQLSEAAGAWQPAGAAGSRQAAEPTRERQPTEPTQTRQLAGLASTAGVGRPTDPFETTSAPAAPPSEPAVLFCAHSIPMSMAATCSYVEQLTETARLVAAGAGVPDERWQLVWQSRSGPPSQPWLTPDVVDAIAELREGTAAVVLAPIGFVSDHMEVVYDLDLVAADAGRTRGLQVVRAATPGTDPRFVAMIRELVTERLDPAASRLAVGRLTPAPDRCATGCCPAPARRS